MYSVFWLFLSGFPLDKATAEAGAIAAPAVLATQLQEQVLFL